MITRRRLAVALIGLGLALVTATAVAMPLYAILDVGATSESQFGSTTTFSLVAFALQALSFFAVGGLLTLRQPGNAVGWICLAIALVWFVMAATSVAVSAL